MTEDQVYQVLLPDLQKVLNRNWMPQDELKLEKRKLSVHLHVALLTFIPLSIIRL